MQLGEYIGYVLINTLPIGTKFYVHNGAWDGKIIELNGVKHVWISETTKFPLTDDYELDITVDKIDADPNNIPEDQYYCLNIFKGECAWVYRSQIKFELSSAFGEPYRVAEF